jgi:hyperosmotically inducible periplasmic protein
MTRATLAHVAIAAVLLTLVACAAKPRRTPYSITMEDATVTAGVKTALLNDPVIGALKIDVHSLDGVVTLSGRVPTRDQEAAAIQLARKVQGVKDVKSEIVIE